MYFLLGQLSLILKKGWNGYTIYPTIGVIAVLIDMSGNISSLWEGLHGMPNGNTVITEGAYGRLFEVTPEHELDWEYINPYFDKRNNANSVYRAFRVPYDWVPQLEKPEEKALPHIDNSKLRLGHLLGGKGQGEDSVRSTKIREGVGGFDQPIQECIESDALDGD